MLVPAVLQVLLPVLPLLRASPATATATDTKMKVAAQIKTVTRRSQISIHK